MIDILVPEEQEGTKAVVRSWLAKVGDVITEDAPLVELETDKVAQEVPAPATGVLKEILLNTDDEATPGAVLGRIEPGAQAGARDAAPQDAAKAPPVFAAPHDEEWAEAQDRDIKPAFLSPAVKKALKTYNLNANAIKGTGRGGRITRDDVERHNAAVGSAASAPGRAAPSSSETASGAQRIPHDNMRRAIAEHMSHSVTAAPHVTAVFEADFSAIIKHRDKHKAEYKKAGVNLTFTAYIVCACVSAMRAVPTVNSRWHDDFLEVFSDVNIGVGTALGDKGLVVPVIKQCQDLSLKGVAARLTEMTEKARKNSLKTEDVRGGTFTISNHGVSGTLVASPVIINQPQSAILGVGKLEKRVKVYEVDGVDTIQIRPCAFVSLTIDHRVLDGHQTNQWLTELVRVLEVWED